MDKLCQNMCAATDLGVYYVLLLAQLRVGKIDWWV